MRSLELVQNIQANLDQSQEEHSRTTDFDSISPEDSKKYGQINWCGWSEFVVGKDEGFS